jgi:hypothetical protein
VREEVNKALELGKAIFPVIYRAGQWAGEFQSLVKEIQTLDLRSGSYTDNFSKLVDGLIEAGAAKATHERPFLHQSTNIPLNIVFRKIPGWAFAWSLGWVVFWIVVLVVLALVVASQERIKGEDVLNFTLILICGAVGGFAGGIFAGLLTMLSLRPNAPSISWKHMSPTIRIWGISGPLGMVVSGIITAILLGIGVIGFPAIRPEECSGGFGQCIGQIIGTAVAGVFIFALIVLLVFAFFVIAAWFLTGMFAGWQVTRHIRRLEPGITSRQAWGVSTGWGCGAIVAAVSMFLLLLIISGVLER